MLILFLAVALCFGEKCPNFADIKIYTHNGQLCQPTIKYHLTKNAIQISQNNTQIAILPDNGNLYQKPYRVTRYW